MVLGLAYRTGVPWNESFWSNAEVRRTARPRPKASSMSKARSEVVKDIEILMQEEGPIVQPLWRSVFSAMDKKVKGFEAHPTHYIFPWKWSRRRLMPQELRRDVAGWHIRRILPAHPRTELPNGIGDGSMLKFFAKRIGGLLFTMLVVSFLIFLTLRVLAAGRGDAALGQFATKEQLDDLQQGSRPGPIGFIDRYGSWLGVLPDCHGEVGRHCCRAISAIPPLAQPRSTPSSGTARQHAAAGAASPSPSSCRCPILFGVPPACAKARRSTARSRWRASITTSIPEFAIGVFLADDLRRLARRAAGHLAAGLRRRLVDRARSSSCRSRRDRALRPRLSSCAWSAPRWSR